MSSYILCQTRRAKVPFYVENISTNLYSLEELCYYMYHNLYLVDQSLINERLCLWIENELWLPGLAAKLRKHLSKFFDLSDVLYPVFKEINYLTYEELKELNIRLNRMDQQPLTARKKERADSLMENGMFVQAIQTYESILKEYISEKAEMREEEIAFRTRVLHNIGCAFSNLFQMEKAAEYFYRAYELSDYEEELVSYLLAYRSLHTEEQFQVRMREVGLSEESKQELADQLRGYLELPEPKLDMEEVDDTIRRITKEYHRSTGS